MNKLLFKKIPFFIKIQLFIYKGLNKMLGRYFNFFFSQTGEDIIILNLLDHKTNGFYVDVGCNDPIRYSNTMLLYLKGWSGICIDANEKIIERFKKFRPADISLCSAVSDEEKMVSLHMSDQSLVSTIDSNFRDNWDKEWIKSEKIAIIKTRTLNSILEEHLKQDQAIDLLSIDVEGHDFNVIKSIDLKKYRPKLIVVEMHNMGIADVSSNEIYSYLTSFGYKLVNYATMNGYFIEA